MCINCKASPLGIQRQAELEASEAEMRRLGIANYHGFIAKYSLSHRYTPEQTNALNRFLAAQQAMKDLHMDYVFECGRQAAQERLERMRKPDYLMEYANALERGDEEAIGAVLKVAETEPGLEAAISMLHRRIDSDRPIPEQIVAMREQV